MECRALKGKAQRCSRKIYKARQKENAKWNLKLNLTAGKLSFYGNVCCSFFPVLNCSWKVVTHSWPEVHIRLIFYFFLKQQTERSLFFKQPIHIPRCLGSGCLYPAISDSDLLFSSPVVPWGETPLPQHTHHPGGDKAGPERRQGHDRKAQGEETLPHYLSSRLDHGERNKSVVTLHMHRSNV